MGRHQITLKGFGVLVNLKLAFLLTAGGEKVNLFLAKSPYLPLPDFIY